MPTLKIAGNCTSALTHFALLGLGNLAQTITDGKVTLGWTDTIEPEAVITSDLTAVDYAEALQSLIHDMNQKDSWVKSRVEYSDGVFSPFSPRFKAINIEKGPDDWSNHQKARQDHLNQLYDRKRFFELRFIQALGEASYWNFDKRSPRPDHGASRWEMKTRNRGEEFVQNRLTLMVEELSTWSAQDILAGISGQRVYDFLGKNNPDSRTSTGLTPPGPTDVALAFIALMGIASFPISLQVHKKSVTPGAFPPQNLHPYAMYLPMTVKPVTLARLNSLITSDALACVAEQLEENAAQAGLGRKEVNSSEVLAAKSWLCDRFATVTVRFPIKKVGSPSAPERQVQRGEIVSLL